MGEREGQEGGEKGKEKGKAGERSGAKEGHRQRREKAARNGQNGTVRDGAGTMQNAAEQDRNRAAIAKGIRRENGFARHFFADKVAWLGGWQALAERRGSMVGSD